MRPALLLAALIWLMAMPALANAQSQGAPPRLTMSEPVRGGLKGHLTLRATLVDDAGMALGMRQIAFYEQSTVFGARDVLLGTATTDSTGFAAIDYQPAQAVEQTIVARFGGDDLYAPTPVSAAIEVREVVPIYTEEALPLAIVRQWLPLGLAGLVLATWAVLIGVAVRTVLGVRAAGRRRAPTVIGSAHTAPEGSSS
jgi:hypothetical protein